MTSILSDITSDESLAKTHSVKLFGRSNEFLALKTAYDRVKQAKSFEKVTVRGESGTGKTTLVMALQQLVIGDGGFFCSSKCFQYSELVWENFSAIMTAFSDLCDLTSQSKDLTDERRALIQVTLGSDAQILLNLVTSLSRLLANGDQNNVFVDNPSGISDRLSVVKLKHACKKFVRAICSLGKPVVIFLDDIQWIDEGSEKILEALLEDATMQNFMLILAYRDDESFLLENILSSKITFGFNIHLTNFEKKSVESLVCKNLGIDPNSVSDDISSLSSLITYRTNGNPFHVLQFIELLRAENRLTYDDESASWRCNVDTIQKNTMMPASLAALLLNKINLLDELSQKLLKMASLLGYSFTNYLIVDFGEYLLVQEGHQDEVSSLLQALLKKSVESKFIEKTLDGYQFTHDKIRATLNEMMEKDEKEKLHYMIGHRFLSKPDEIFHYAAALHLNCAANNFSKNIEDRVFLAKINFKAAKYCDGNYAFEDAKNFIIKGLSLLGEGESKWSTNFDLALEMTLILGKLELALGNIADGADIMLEILARTSSRETKVDTINVLFGALAYQIFDANGRPQETKGAIRKTMKELGVDIPRILTPLHVFTKLRKLRKIMDSKQDEEIMSLPPIHPDFAHVVKIVSHISLLFFITKRYVTGLYLDVLAAECTLVNGLCKDTANALFNLGKVEVMLGESSRGYRLGKLALQFISTRAPLDVEDHIVLIFSHYLLLCQKERIKMNDSIVFTRDSLNRLLANGCPIEAGMCEHTSFFLRLLTGDSLEALENSIKNNYRRLQELDQGILIDYTKPLLQFVLNMRNKTETCWESLILLTGEVMNEESYLDLLATLNPHTTTVFRLLKLMLAFTFGYYDEAEKMLQKVTLSLDQKRSFNYFTLLLYSFLIFYERYKLTGYRRYLHKARQAQKILRSCHVAGNPNATPHLQLTEAVEFSIKATEKDVPRVRYTFDCAIETLEQSGWIHLLGVANEFAANALARFDGDHGTNCYLEKAMDAYKNKWGATAKFRWLTEKQNDWH